MVPECPVCGGEVSVAGDAVVGELMECSECGTELEVVSTDPVSVAEAPQEQEDWGE